MSCCACFSGAATLQLVIDAGGDVCRPSGGRLPLVTAVWGDSGEEKVRVLLAQPCLDLTVNYDGRSPQQFARDYGEPVLGSMIAQEVSGKGFSIWLEARFLVGAS